jgi:hypothetical protein
VKSTHHKNKPWITVIAKKWGPILMIMNEEKIKSLILMKF